MSGEVSAMRVLCRASPQQGWCGEFEAMTTRCELRLYGLGDAAALELAERIRVAVAQLVARYNFHDPASWLNREVNGRRRNVVELDEQTLAILAEVRQHAQRSGGAFDITIGTLAAQLARAEDADAVKAVYRRLGPYLGLQRWRLEGQRLHFDNPYTRVDLGGVIKEYAVDLSACMAHEAGVAGALINYGGDLRAIGRKPDGRRFVAAVPDPRRPQAMLFALDLQDQALTTSAHYARHRLIRARPGAARGLPLSHVRSPQAAVQGARWVSASVLSTSTLISGIYSTALLSRDELVLPDGATAVLVDAEGRIATLGGAAATVVVPTPSAMDESTRNLQCA